MEEGHSGHLAALGPHFAEGRDDLRPCEQGHEGEVCLLFLEWVLGDTHQSCRDGGQGPVSDGPWMYQGSGQIYQVLMEGTTPASSLEETPMSLEPLFPHGLPG